MIRIDISLSMLVMVLFHLALSSSIELVSIIDKSSVLSCLLKLHTIVESSNEPGILSFKFLLFPSEGFSVESWNEQFKVCFPNVRFETKLWAAPPALQNLSRIGFDTELIYARFYLPHFFPGLRRFMYLDNDVIVTADLYDLYGHRMLKFETISPASDKREVTPVVNPRTVEYSVPPPHKHSSSGQHEGQSATVAFVYETHPFYREYLKLHFNGTASVVKAAAVAHGEDAFLNAGVFLVDAARWRQLRFTQRFEELHRLNTGNSIYDSSAVGDQGPFYLLFSEETAYMAARYNMRRLPKKTVNILQEAGTTGILHFAGSAQGRSEFLCADPLKYPLFLSAAMPLLLSVVHSFLKKCGGVSEVLSNSLRLCVDAVPIVQQELSNLKIHPKFEPGRGNFRWPIN
jgi:hypothetical protein